MESPTPEGLRLRACENRTLLERCTEDSVLYSFFLKFEYRVLRTQAAFAVDSILSSRKSRLSLLGVTSRTILTVCPSKLQNSSIDNGLAQSLHESPAELKLLADTRLSASTSLFPNLLFLDGWA